MYLNSIQDKFRFEVHLIFFPCSTEDKCPVDQRFWEIKPMSILPSSDGTLLIQFDGTGPHEIQPLKKSTRGFLGMMEPSPILIEERVSEEFTIRWICCLAFRLKKPILQQGIFAFSALLQLPHCGIFPLTPEYFYLIKKNLNQWKRQKRQA